MVSSKATMVAHYLAELTPERRAAIQKVRRLILDYLPDGYTETMQYGMISFVVPFSLYPPGYDSRKHEPLPFTCLASQKNYMSIYFMGLYADKDAEKQFLKEYKASGKKLDMGKGCLRFRKVEDLPLDVIGRAIARTPVRSFIAQYERARKKVKGKR